MNEIPTQIGSSKVLYYAVVNLLNYQGIYEKTAHGFAICRSDENGYYLFSCDDNWQEFADTWHESIEDAIDQAESECPGISELLQKAT